MTEEEEEEEEDDDDDDYDDYDAEVRLSLFSLALQTLNFL